MYTFVLSCIWKVYKILESTWTCKSKSRSFICKLTRALHSTQFCRKVHLLGGIQERVVLTCTPKNVQPNRAAAFLLSEDRKEHTKYSK